MAKKQTRRSISVSRTTYERLKSFCEANNISMSQLVETQVNGFLGTNETTTVVPTHPRPTLPSPPRPAPTSSSHLGSAGSSISRPSETRSMATTTTTTTTSQPNQVVPMTSAAARFAVEPPPPIIKPKQETAAPKPAEKRPDQIFTF